MHTKYAMAAAIIAGLSSSVVQARAIGGGAGLAGIIQTQSGGSTTVTEGGAADTYTFVLTTQPTADVVIGMDSGPQLGRSPASLTFTTVNWNIPQTVTVNAVDDTAVEGPHTDTITHTVASADPTYALLTTPAVTVSITDNDVNVGGTVSGLAGSGLVLQLNGGGNLPIAANGAFTFPASVTTGSTYTVTVLAQPAGQACTVTNGTGTAPTTSVTNVQVDCAAIAIAVSATQLDFGTIDFLGSATRMLTVSNPGTADLQLQSASIPTGPFSISGGTCAPLPRTLAAGASCTIVVTFQPVDANIAQATLTIGSNAQGAPTLVALRGGVAPRQVPTTSPLALGLLALLVLVVAGVRRRSMA